MRVGLRKLFVVSAGVAAGVVATIAALIVAWNWWGSRPVARDTSSVTAEFDRVIVQGTGDRRTVELRYKLRNTTRKDISVAGLDLTTYVRREDGSLYDLKKGQIFDTDQGDINIPAGEQILWFLVPGLPYRSHSDCTGFVLYDDPSREQARQFLAKCYPWMTSFLMHSNDDQHLRIELPLPISKE